MLPECNIKILCSFPQELVRYTPTMHQRFIILASRCGIDASNMSMSELENALASLDDTDGIKRAIDDLNDALNHEARHRMRKCEAMFSSRRCTRP